APLQIQRTQSLGKFSQSSSQREGQGGTRTRNQTRSIRSRSIVRKFNSRPGDRCSAEGQFGTSRNAHGDGARRIPAVHPFSAAQSEKSALVWSRSVRAVGGSWLNAALQLAPSDGIRFAAQRD